VAFSLGQLKDQMTQENATQPGAFESAPSARSQAMAEIVRKVHAQTAEDSHSFDEEAGEIGARVEAPAPQEQAQTPAPQPEQQEQQETQQVVSTPADDGLETIVIDGQERKVKREQIIEAGRRTLQKESAADKRLEEAAETLRRARAIEASLLRGQPSSDAGGYEQMPSSDASNGTARPQAAATPDLGMLVDERLWLRDAEKAAQRFKEEFKDLADDPLAARLVVQLENERIAALHQEGKPITSGDPWQAYEQLGAKVREWLGKAKPTGQVQVSTDKAERKRSTVTVTGSTTSRPAPQPKKPETVAEQIEKMRIARMGRSIPIAR
jgi:hypothetical protein